MRQKGVAHLLLIVVIVVFALGVGGYLLLQKSKQVSTEGIPKKESTFFGDLKTKIAEPKEVCLTNEEYGKVTDPNAPVLSIPFDLDNYYTKHWGIVPFCAELRNGQMHGALDFELKPDSKVYSAADGVVTQTQVGREEGSGEIIQIKGNGFSVDYSGLTNLQFNVGDRVKKGEQIGNAVQIPHGEYHVHMGLLINGKQECPLKYMDEDFYEAFEQMFAAADYRTQTDAPCACNCESVEVNF